MVSRKITFLGRRSDASFDSRTKSGVDEGLFNLRDKPAQPDFSISPSLVHCFIQQ